MAKTILYYKNAKGLFQHYVSDAIPGSWHFSPSAFDAHILPHFRDEISKYWIEYNFTTTITDLNIDFEYLFFLLQNYTNFCV